ncbi:MAG: ribonuclease HI [Patescibacteria group bacterium]|nr:ribonuclease HI [Patescibacteria group bacterium]
MVCGFKSRSWHMDYNALNIYTDGSFHPDNRNGGVGILFVFPEHLNIEPKSFCPYGYKKATNNQMELKACCIALKESLKLEKQWSRIVINSDSIYVIDGYKSAIFWRSNGWKTHNGRPVSNAELWKEFLKIVVEVRLPVDFQKVKAHAKNENNNKVDKLAKESRDKAYNSPIKIVTVRRKITKKKNEIGSVKLIGQRLGIRIIEVEYLKLSRSYKCKYEVMSKSSEYFSFVDVVYSKDVLRVGHEYSVKFNNNNKCPEIDKIYKDKTRAARNK